MAIRVAAGFAIVLGAFLTAVTAAAIAGRSPLRPVAAIGTFGTFATLGTFAALRSLAAVGTIVAIVAIVAIIAVRAIAAVARPAIGAIVVATIRLTLGVVAHLIVEIVVVTVVATLPALLFEPRPAFAEHAVIMVGELEIIFSLDAIAGELRVARHALVLFVKLGGIAALAIVLAIAIGPAANVLRPLSTATTTPAALTIVDQIHFLQQKPAPWLFGQAERRKWARP